MEPQYQCQDCDAAHELEALHECRDIWERVQPGDTMPFGDCPACGGACFPVDPAKQPMRLVISVLGGVAEIADSTNWPGNVEVYIADFDCDGSDGEPLIDGSPVALSRMAGTQDHDGELVAKVIEAWGHAATEEGTAQ